MSIGDVINPKRLRTQANERLDTVDVDALSANPRSLLDAWARAVTSVPRNVGGSNPTGLIIQGFGLTLNPTAPSDNKIRVQSAVGVAIDANGRMLIKESGVQVDLTLPGGTSQVYAYFVEDASDNTVRRLITVTSPYTEGGSAITTTFKGDVGYWVRSGDQTSIVASDVINGATTALCFLGVATNAAGVITMTGYDATTAPNGLYATNRLTAVAAPSTPPPANTANGSVVTLHDLIGAALYSVGQASWKGSDFLTPSAANDFGAYKQPAGGVDKAFRQALGYVTVGNGTTVFGDFNSSDYANSNALLTAAIASLPTQGGTIFIKRGVQLTGFNSATVSLPASKTVSIVGEHIDVPSNLPQLTFAASESLTCSASGRLSLENLHVRFAANAVVMTTSPVRVRNVYFECSATTDAGAALQGTNVSDLDIERMTLSTVLTTATANGMGVRITGSARRVRIRKFSHTTNTPTKKDACSIAILDMREDVVIDDFVYSSALGGGTGGTGAAIKLDTTDNTTNVQNRVLQNLLFGPTDGFCLDIGNVGYLTIDKYTDAFNTNSLYGLSSATYAGLGPVVICRSFINTSVQFTGNFPDLRFDDCTFTGGTVSVGSTTSTTGKVVFDRCIAQGGTQTPTITVQGANVAYVRCFDCTFDNVTTYAAGVPVGALNIIAQTQLDAVELNCNRINNIQNITFTGAITTYPFIFDVRGGNIRSVVCSGNRMSNIQNTSSGAFARLGVYLARVGGPATAGAPEGISPGIVTVDELVMKNNVIGGDAFPTVGMGDTCMLVRMTAGTCRGLSLCDNEFRVMWSDTLGDTQLGDLIRLNVSGTHNWVVDDNHVALKNRSNTSFGFDVLRAVGLQSTVMNMSFAGNKIYAAALGGGSPWDHVNFWGLHMDGAGGLGHIDNLNMWGNAVSVDTFSGSSFATRFDNFAAINRTLPNGGVPAAGISWGFNLLIYGG